LKQHYTNHVDCTDAIARHLARNVPGKWRRIEAQVKVNHEIEMVTRELVYYPPGSSSKKEHFRIEDGEEDVEFGDCFVQLAGLLSTPEKGLFEKCRFTLESDGKYRAEYEYPK
jgi:hypothetical protein